MHRFERIALRMDDIGSSSKKYEVYSNKFLRLGKVRISGNVLCLKYMPPFRAWGPYRELSPDEWYSILGLLRNHKAKLTIGVTAAWVKSEKELIVFPERFPQQAAIIKEGMEQGLLEVANHGLTHCIIENNIFKPKLLESNREFHREFGPNVPIDIQEEHIQRSQTILQEWTGAPVVTFVPPGNLFTDKTVEIAAKYGIRYLSCNVPRQPSNKLVILGNENILAFHDRDIVFGGIEWLERLIQDNSNRELCFVRDLETAI